MRLWTRRPGQSSKNLSKSWRRCAVPNGCPWDKQQDFNSLKPMLVEEVYEVLEAIENKDFEGFPKSSAMSCCTFVFHAQLGKEAGQFDINTVIEKISEQTRAPASACFRRRIGIDA